MKTIKLMKEVQEYHEGMGVELTQTDGLVEFGLPEEQWKGRGRFVIEAYNEGGYNSTAVDLEHLFQWLKKNEPKLFNTLINL